MAPRTIGRGFLRRARARSDRPAAECAAAGTREDRAVRARQSPARDDPPSGAHDSCGRATGRRPLVAAPTRRRTSAVGGSPGGVFAARESGLVRRAADGRAGCRGHRASVSAARSEHPRREARASRRGSGRRARRVRDGRGARAGPPWRERVSCPPWRERASCPLRRERASCPPRLERAERPPCRGTTGARGRSRRGVSLSAPRAGLTGRGARRASRCRGSRRPRHPRAPARRRSPARPRRAPRPPRRRAPARGRPCAGGRRRCARRGTA